MDIIAPTKDEILAEYMEECDDVIFERVHRESRDDWRHGSTIMEVYKRLADGTYWAVNYRKSGDGEYNGMREEEFDIIQVVPYEVVTTKYKVAK